MRAVILVGAMVATASAQPLPEEPPQPQPPPPEQPQPEQPPPPPEPVPVVPALDPAWSLYDQAFGHAAKGDRERARSQLLELSTRWPSHPAAMRAARLAVELAPRPVSKKSGVARGELVFWSTFGGVLVALNICEIAECSTDRENAAVYSLSVGGSLALSLAASRNGVEPGQAQLYNSSQTW